MRDIDDRLSAQGFSFTGNYLGGREFDQARDWHIDQGAETRTEAAFDRDSGEPLPDHEALYTKDPAIYPAR